MGFIRLKGEFDSLSHYTLPPRNPTLWPFFGPLALVWPSVAKRGEESFAKLRLVKKKPFFLDSMHSALRPWTTSIRGKAPQPTPQPGISRGVSTDASVSSAPLAVLQRVCQRQGTLVIGISLRGRGYRTSGVYRVAPRLSSRPSSRLGQGSTLGYPYPHSRVGFKVGKAHRDWLDLPRGVAFVVAKKQKYLLCGQDPQQLGQVARRLQAFRPQNPYVGSGFLMQRR